MMLAAATVMLVAVVVVVGRMVGEVARGVRAQRRGRRNPISPNTCFTSTGQLGRGQKPTRRLRRSREIAAHGGEDGAALALLRGLVDGDNGGATHVGRYRKPGMRDMLRF